MKAEPQTAAPPVVTPQLAERRETQRMLHRWRAARTGTALPPLAALGREAVQIGMLVDPVRGTILQRGERQAALTRADPIVGRILELAAVALALDDGVEVEDWCGGSTDGEAARGEAARLFRAALLPVIDATGTARVLAVIGWTVPSLAPAPPLPII